MSAFAEDSNLDFLNGNLFKPLVVLAIPIVIS